MQLLPTTASRPASHPSFEGPADRFRAAVTLVNLPNTLYDIVERGAAAADASGVRVSAADLVRPYRALMSVEATRATLLDAVEGALRVAPEYESRRAAVTDAANAVADLVARSARDRAVGGAWDIATRFIDELDAAAEELYALSTDLHPSNG